MIARGGEQITEKCESSCKNWLPLFHKKENIEMHKSLFFERLFSKPIIAYRRAKIWIEIPFSLAKRGRRYINPSFSHFGALWFIWMLFQSGKKEGQMFTFQKEFSVCISHYYCRQSPSGVGSLTSKKGPFFRKRRRQNSCSVSNESSSRIMLSWRSSFRISISCRRFAKSLSDFPLNPI